MTDGSCCARDKRGRTAFKISEAATKAVGENRPVILGQGVDKGFAKGQKGEDQKQQKQLVAGNLVEV
jgi:hypothetical protein